MTKDDALEFLRCLLTDHAKEEDVARLRDLVLRQRFAACGSVLWQAVNEAHEYLTQETPV
jgi:hypothetical protein